jgi:DNA adenine methylase
LKGMKRRCKRYTGSPLRYARGKSWAVGDLPYYIGKDSTLFKELYPQRNFPIHHNGFKHELLRDLLHWYEGVFILSYNDSPTIRE